MDKLVQIARYGRQYIQGIDWEAIQAETGLAPNDAVYDLAYLDALAAAYRQALGVRNKLTLSIDVAASAQGLAAWEQSKNIITNRSEQFMAAVNANAQWISGAPEFHVETYRALISRVWINVVSAMQAHMKLILQHGGVAPEDIVASADIVYSGCKGIVTLYELGMLDPIKRSGAAPTPAPTSGLGVAAGGVAVVVLASLVGLAVIAWVIYAGENAAQTAQLADDLCEAAINEPDPELREPLLEACVEVRKAIATELNKDPGEAALNTAVTILSVGVIAYGAVLLLPRVMESWRKRKIRATVRGLEG